MTLRTSLMALGAVLLLIAGITLPAAAAGWGAGSGLNQSTATSGTCPQCADCNQTHARIQNQTANQSGLGYHNGLEDAALGSDQTVGHHGECLGADARQQGTGNAGAEQGSGQRLGDCDQTQLRQRLHDGSCGNCPKSTS